jgi:molybdenum cofactor cytidylyltransferase
MSAPLISVVVLAAGQSTRMEGAHKLTLDVAGEPLVRRTVQAVLGIAPVETIIVTGFAADEVKTALSGLDVRLVHNADYAGGQPGSVAAGVKALRDYCHAVMVVPGDQALLIPANLQELITAYVTCDRAILVPFHNGQRGNPIMFAAHFIPLVTSGGVNIGCRHLIETNGADVAQVEFDSDAFITDCDTPADYAALIARFVAPHPGAPTHVAG